MIKNQVLCQSRYASDLDGFMSVNISPLKVTSEDKEETVNRSQNTLNLRYNKCLKELQSVLLANREIKQQSHLLQSQFKNVMVQKTQIEELVGKAETECEILLNKNREYQQLLEILERDLNNTMGALKENNERYREKEKEILALRYSYERELEERNLKIDALHGEIMQKDRIIVHVETQFNSLNERVMQYKRGHEGNVQPGAKRWKQEERPRDRGYMNVSVESIYEKYFPSMAATLKQNRVNLNMEEQRPSQSRRSPFERRYRAAPHKSSDNRLGEKYFYLNSKYRILVKERNLNDYKIQTYESLIERLEGEIEEISARCQCRGLEGFESSLEQGIRKYMNDLNQSKQQIVRLNQVVSQQGRLLKEKEELEARVRENQGIESTLRNRVIDLKEEVLGLKRQEQMYQREINQNMNQIHQLKSFVTESLNRTNMENRNIPNMRLVNSRREETSRIDQLQLHINELEKKLNEEMEVSGHYDSQEGVLHIRRSDSKTHFLLKIQKLTEENRVLANYKYLYEQLYHRCNQEMVIHESRRAESKGDNGMKGEYQKREKANAEKIAIMEETIEELVEQNRRLILKYENQEESGSGRGSGGVSGEYDENQDPEMEEVQIYDDLDDGALNLQQYLNDREMDMGRGHIRNWRRESIARNIL